MTKPSLVLADEPTGNLDSDTAEQIYQLIRSLNKTAQTSFVIVTHDLVLANRMDRQVKLVQGQLFPLSASLDDISITAAARSKNTDKVNDIQLSEPNV